LLLIEVMEQLANRSVELGWAVEPSIAQPRQNTALDDEDCGLDLGLVARPARPGWQHGGAVMRRHLGIGSVDLRLVQTGLDDGDLGLIGNDETRHAADGCKGARVGTNPIAKRLRPGRLDVGEVRGAHDRDEDLCLAHLAGQPVDDTGTVSPA
jgi:hypothetical protein